MADESQPRGRSHWIVWTMALVVVLPILYVLSTGPVLWLLLKTGGMDSQWFQVFAVIYEPLDWLGRHSPGFTSFMQAYLKFFDLP